jgi:hypothetical protein
MVSGTVVIRERHLPMASPPLFVPGHLVQWAQSLELSRLSDELANTSREYLARYTELEPAAQVALGDALAFRVGGVTAPAPPVAISSPAFLSAVLAERRRRELARLATQRPTYGTNTGPFGSPYAPPSPYGAPVYSGPQPGSPFPAPQQGPYSPPPPVAPRPQDTVVNPGGWHAPGSNEPSQSY